MNDILHELTRTLEAMKNIGKIGIMALLAGAMGFGAGCDSTGPEHSAQFSQAAQKIAVGGTVVFRDGASGSFYGILADNGGQYEPANLEQRYRNDGARIEFSGMLDTTQLGEHHWGNPLQLASVSEAK